MKYLCRGKCSTLPWGTKDIPVQSGSTAKDQRFSLDDHTAARVFTITITDLRPEDGGTYWCGIQKSNLLPDIYTEVLLLVTLGPPPPVSYSTYSPPSSVQTQPTRPPPLTPTVENTTCHGGYTTPRGRLGFDSLSGQGRDCQCEPQKWKMALGTKQRTITYLVEGSQSWWQEAERLPTRYSSGPLTSSTVSALNQTGLR
ncbi:hypothetical protein NFI96_001895, partial [Prochilodus magdalenae]